MKRVPVYGRTGVVAYALVDDADRLLIAQFQWRVQRGKTFYAKAYVDGGTIYMHRLILGLKPGDPGVDHENGNGLDNRRSNLRHPASKSENGANRHALRGSASRYKGVSRNKGRWRAVIMVDRQYRHLGTFDTEKEAARAYDEAAREQWGEFAKTNIPAIPSNRKDTA